MKDVQWTAGAYVSFLLQEGCRKGDQNQVDLFTVMRPLEHTHPLPCVLVDVQQR